MFNGQLSFVIEGAFARIFHKESREVRFDDK